MPEWYRPVGRPYLVQFNFVASEGHSICQAGRDPLGQRDMSAWCWDYGDQEEAQSDLYRLLD